MFTHMIEEDAYHLLTRAMQATSTLSNLITRYEEHCGDSIPASEISVFIDHINNDIREGLQGCEELQSSLHTQPLRIVSSQSVE
ncbi:hypothetical protein ACF3VQ_01955 [Yersinia sp. HM-2024]|uniref:hypothetical protein n=1 Tax=Yersinia sp. HM-2024 TaxID=3344550 RepID=UPI00370DC162